MRAGAVAMLDLASEQPAYGLQSGMGVRRDVHAAGDGHIVGAIVVHKAPGADERSRTLRKRPAHAHGARAAQRHLPWGQDLDGGSPEVVHRRGRSGAALLKGGGLDVAHRYRLRPCPRATLADESLGRRAHRSKHSPWWIRASSALAGRRYGSGAQTPSPVRQSSTGPALFQTGIGSRGTSHHLDPNPVGHPSPRSGRVDDVHHRVGRRPLVAPVTMGGAGGR